MSVVLSGRDITFSFRLDIPFCFQCFIINNYFKDWPLCDNTMDVKAMTLHQYHQWGTEVSSTMTVKLMVFWDVIPCCSINVNWCLRATCCLCHVAGSRCTPVSIHFQKAVVISAIEFMSLQPLSQQPLFSCFLLSTYGCF